MQNHLTRTLSIAVGCLCLVAYPVFATAQPGNPGFVEAGAMELAPGVPAPAETNHPDRVFVLVAAAGGMSEVQLGKLAQERAASDDVQAFGKRMTEDHGKANEKLAGIAKKLALPLPDAPDPKHRGQREHLENLEGKAFDLAYLGQQLGAHQMTAQLLEYEIGSGHNPALKDFASETLPIVLEHLAMIQQLEGRLRGATSTQPMPNGASKQDAVSK